MSIRFPLRWIAVSLLVAWSVLPFLWQFITSLQSPEEVFRTPVSYFPEHPSLRAYGDVLAKRPFLAYLANSLSVAGLTVLLTLLAAVPAGWYMARRGGGGVAFLKIGLLVAALFPPVFLLVPLPAIFQSLGLLDRPLALAVPYAALSLPIASWILAATFRAAPPALEEAAVLDGAGFFRRLAWVHVPLAAPGILSAAILTFVYAYNEFALALCVLTAERSRTVSVGIALLSGASPYEIPWNLIAAATVLSVLPLILLACLASRWITEGLTAGAVAE